MIRVVLVQLITRIPGARIPKSVNVTDLLDQTIKFFVTENPDLYNNTETTSMNTEVSFLLDRTESQEPGYYTSEYLGGIGKSSNSQVHISCHSHSVILSVSKLLFHLHNKGSIIIHHIHLVLSYF